jgi:hypothetical protein
MDRHEAQLSAILTFLEAQAKRNATRSRRNAILLTGLLLVGLANLLTGCAVTGADRLYPLHAYPSQSIRWNAYGHGVHMDYSGRPVILVTPGNTGPSNVGPTF